MLPFFPSLRPSITNSICFDVDVPCDDENELREMEREHVAWVSVLNTNIDSKENSAFYESIILD